jgi:arylsulfatase A-like enzyme
MISEFLKPAGYNTSAVGKWHLGATEEFVPNARGFDEYYGFLDGAHDYERWNSEESKRKSLDPIYRNKKPLPGRKNVYLTDLFSDESVKFIDKQKKDNPFFLYMSYNAVHAPWQVPDKYLKRTKKLNADHERQLFAAMVLAMDDGIGRVRKLLKKKGLYDNTIIIFLTDNGTPRGQGLNNPRKDPMKERGGCTMSNSLTFRGFKGDTYEGGIRVPFLITWPGKIKSGTTYDLPVSSLDIVPTLLSAAGVKSPDKPEFDIDGVDLMPYLSGKNKKRPHEILYWRRDNDYAIRKGDWKLTWNDTSGTKEIMLFDMKNDPNEYKNVLKKNPEKAQQLQDLFDNWDGQLSDSYRWGGPVTRNRRYKHGRKIDVLKQPYIDARGKFKRKKKK